jgi:orotate phosphoribosyltransferase
MPAFVDPARAARLTARALLEVGAVRFRADQPYTLTSGMKSPVYVDVRRLISHPRLRAALMALACDRVMEAAGFERFDAVAGGETAGIPFAAWMADRLGLPMLYVRKKPKGFGRNARIEGEPREGWRVLLVEDLATDGGSKLSFAEALREARMECAHGFVLFHYGAFPEGDARLAEAGLTLHRLATWRDVLALAREEARFDAATLDAVAAFLDAPREWSSLHGGA